ncbi:AAA family ATPase [Protaetiibacter sp. SSC-01]|uniref:AAA family ATPase n=1 Tax=Protaetiibacter sp. SSC-01 TaxID=2759943 RepID=UPI0016575840|nr:AAA family ATPase [Protaetiibacter sp. SSC-01]QNO36701.1 AAA family ATPase [Protaetiibacter sp. SSC-01]
MTTESRTPQRLRRAIELLSEGSPANTRATLWAAVRTEIPLTEYEAALLSNGVTRAETDWAFASSNLVKSGWLVKDGNGGWAITEAGRGALRNFPDPVEFARTAAAAYKSWRDEQAAALSRGIVPADDKQALIVDTAKLFAERGLAELSSVFSPGRSVWNERTTAELIAKFVDSDGSGAGSFVEKVAQQLSDATDDARLLMAELVALQLLPASTDTIGADKKLARVQAVLDLMDHPVQVPAEIRAAFGAGAFNPGVAMANSLGAAMTIMVNFADSWVRLPEEERIRLLEDPWEFRDFVHAVPGTSFPSQRLSLMYLMHPETFTSIVQADARERIRNAFIGEIDRGPSDLDRDLRDIWVALQVKHKKRIHFWMPEFLEVWSKEDASSTKVDAPIPAAQVTLPAPDEALAGELLISREWLDQAMHLLARRKQVVLYGPPGTGKTYLAKALSRYASGGVAPSIVQFHPSYSYEDFVAGYRPATVDGQLHYRLKAGPLLRLSEEAAKNPERPHFLVIDEINRGNLAKVFGELYFLLEYRNEEIDLLYGHPDGDGAKFALPANLFIIGTMNTSDRSIALLDAAMRRRFGFLELHPDREPIRGLLPAWLRQHGQDAGHAEVLAELNRRIADRSLRVGPSYLMPRDGILDEPRLREIWAYEILPLLEEMHFGEDINLEAEYGLDSLRRSMAAARGDEAADSPEE